ncbi:two-component system sensor histidine kinase/response regulator [Pseudomonas tohonis]|uniref:histidine kinase n=1 Tax=Pseudomonas tohonis TaxID=2725477 RepID=A0A6J4E6R0_9PSED|nr:response regulator [Pseudomonas tohonis]BCG25633.1 two-component system sensor histidine kinase/response regulator [Pseudomonas tohonis]GJN56129.1 two-component system sensor histidine kinase/response regulator [Pseudomonas tohonis]
MNATASIDERSFRRILSRNVALPIGIGVLGAALFIALIGYLLYVLSWVEHTDMVMGKANEGFRYTLERESSLRGYLIAGDDEFLDPFEEATPRLESRMEELAELVGDNPVQLEKVRRIEAMQERWGAFAQEMIERRRANQDVTTAIREKRGKQLVDGIRRTFADFIATEQQLRHERNERASNTAIFTVVAYLLFSLGFSGLLAFIGRRELLGLSRTYGATLERQLADNQKLQQQAWLREGQSRLAEAIIGQQSSSSIGRAVLDFLAQYLGMVVGALYVRQENGELRRVADYGFSPEEQAREQAFADGAGMVGQVAVERRSRVLEGLAPGYLKVNSGLGSDDPLAVMLAPTATEGSVNGIVELGFLRPLDERDQAFLDAIGGSLGASIEAARYRQRLHDVLTETQQLNEELQVQQEELRTANEELEDQSRLIRESQASLETQQAELEQTNEQLNEKTLRLVEQRDTLDERNHALDRARKELEQRAEELERASRYKSEFLANMSHELRTPLNSSLILSKLLAENRKGNLDGQQVKYAELIYSSGTDLLKLINDILDIAKVEAGRLEIRPEQTELARMVENLENLFRPQATEKQLEFQVQVDAAAPRQFFSDSQRVEQILKNLLSNAFKFTHEGSVRLRVRPAEGGIAFEVADTGIGISQEQQNFIFEAFRQADGTTNRRFGGTGLGLSISRNLAQMLGGSIVLRSEPGQGSLFTLWLPESYQAEEAAPEPVEPAPLPEPTPAPDEEQPEVPAFPDDRGLADQGGRCVLVIEDEPKFAQILYDLAHELGYRCLVAQSAGEGLRLAGAHGPDAILLDMRLPDDSGLSVLQRLKDDPHTRHIPVHVVSTDDRTEPALHLGAIGYAQKPTTRELLVDVFSRLEAKLTQKVKRVLVVEGDASQRDGITRLVGDEDIQVVAAERGEEALARLRETQFDCMIIDLKLPDMHGNELLKRMAAEDLGTFPPVIVYSSRNLTRDEEEDLLKHSRSIIIKGARSPERLLDEVTLFLHKVESSLSSERQRMLQTARNRDKVFEKRKVLVVDDDVRNIFALISALDEKGTQVVTARNGQEAIDKLEENPDIDLVLMDVMMPVMDGYEATRRIRQEPRWARLPIIAVTAKAMKDDQEQCMKAGASDYLAKPIDLERLFSLIRVWLPQLERF